MPEPNFIYIQIINRMASIIYFFDINGNNVKLSLKTYHEPNLCEGKYFATEKGNILEIYYFDNNLNCMSANPKFFIKKENNKFYIKGVGGEGTNTEWKILK